VVIRYNFGLLDDYVAPRITEFTEAAITSLAAELDQCGPWMLFFGIQDAVGRKLKHLPARTFRQFVRRTVSALRAYETMRLEVEAFLSNQMIDSPKTHHYFHALDSAETCLLQCQMAFESVERSGTIPGVSKSELPVLICSMATRGALAIVVREIRTLQLYAVL
jgi:hypothetical protein